MSDDHSAATTHKPRPRGTRADTSHQAAVGAVVVATGCVTALVVVSTVTDADALSVVALALAVIALIAQLVMFIGQTMTTGQQMLQAESLNAETKSLLTELKTSSSGVQSMLKDQYDKLLAVALDKASEVGATRLGDEEKFQPVIRRAIREAISDELRVAPPDTVHERAPDFIDFDTADHSDDAGKPEVDDKRAQAIIDLRTWPGADEAEHLLAELSALPAFAVAQMQRYATDHLTSLQLGTAPGLRYKPGESTVADLLEQRGLIEIRAEPTRGGEKVARLSPKGLMVARLLLAPPPPPPAVRKLMGFD